MVCNSPEIYCGKHLDACVLDFYLRFRIEVLAIANYKLVTNKHGLVYVTAYMCEHELNMQYVS